MEQNKEKTMKQKKYVFFRYSFNEDPDSTPDKRVDNDKIQSLFGDIFCSRREIEDLHEERQGRCDVA